MVAGFTPILLPVMENQGNNNNLLSRYPITLNSRFTANDSDLLILPKRFAKCFWLPQSVSRGKDEIFPSFESKLTHATLQLNETGPSAYQ